MSWFYYSGNVTRSITIKKGLSVVAKPHSKVEILDANLPEVRALRRKGHLRVTSRPKDAKSVNDLPVMTGEDVKRVTSKSKLAGWVAEKGVAFSKGETPRSKNPEMTDGEREAAPKNAVSESKDSEIPKEEDNKNAENVEVLSDDEKESDPGEYGDKKKSKKGRSRKG